mmetsp:Transcript_26597/g.45104  ORF Transcript_26597/g.45104 Transcript_26597/m.45104 type:complete len:88 (-) Transcript_26597:2100-2363(-)
MYAKALAYNSTESYSRYFLHCHNITADNLHEILSVAELAPPHQSSKTTRLRGQGQQLATSPSWTCDLRSQPGFLHTTYPLLGNTQGI